MRSTTGLCATLLAGAGAVKGFMIPPGVALENIGRPGPNGPHHHGPPGGLEKFKGWMKHGGPPAVGMELVGPYSRALTVDCAGCLFAKFENENGNKDGKIVWVEGVENKIYLNISVGAQPQTLELNGARIYPPVMDVSYATSQEVPYIAQVPSTASLVEIKSNTELTAHPLRLTSWSLQAGSSKTIDESGREILKIHLQLNALERQSINVPDITIVALKDEEGRLIILKVENESPEHGHGHGGPGGPPKECHNWPLLCRWRAIIASKLHSFKGLAHHGGCKGKGKGMMGMHHGSPPSKDGERPHHGMFGGPPPTNMHHGPDAHHDGAGKDGPHHGPDRHHGSQNGSEHRGHRRPHHGGHRHHRHHSKVARILHVIGKVMLTVIVPILLGVAAGMITYLLGMVVGASVGFVWMKIRPASAYQRVALDEEEGVEPRGSMDKVEYTDEKVEAPPVYVEVEANEVVKK